MGRTTYDAAMVADLDARLPAHLQVTITAKLRGSETFVFSWNDSREVGSGRASVWWNPSRPLSFRFLGSRPPQINRLW